MTILISPVQYIASTPPVTRAFAAVTFILSLLYYWVSWSSSDPYGAPYLILVPGTSIFFPWSFLTAGLVETSLVELVLTILVIPPSLRYFERLWGAAETIKFIVVTIVASNIIAFGLSWIEYFVFQTPAFAFGIQYHGQMALQAGILVAFTQAIPEHQIQIFGIFKARVKSLPMAYNTFSVVMSIIGYQSPYLLIQFGWLASYVWLRFYKKNSADALGGSTVYGDRSETFAFIMWFPPFAHGPVSVLADTLYSLATRFHLIPSSGHDIEAGYTQVPGGARAEAERRRAMALKALDQRMAGGPSSSTNGPATSSNASRQQQEVPHGRTNSAMDPKPNDAGKDPAR